jgi:hypothetical protein
LPGGTPGEDIAAKIVQAGHTKVGVIPSVITRKGTREATVGSLGPRAATLAKDVQNQLVALSTQGPYRGKFTVVSERVMRNALNEVGKSGPIGVQELGNPKALKALSSYTGAKGFVQLGHDETIEKVEVLDGNAKPGEGDTSDSKTDDNKPEPKKQDTLASTDSKLDPDLDDGLVEKRDLVEKIEASYVDDDGDEYHNETYRDRTTFSKAAYAGDSFELRRWQGNELVNIGLESQHPTFDEDSNWQFGFGEKWELAQYQYLKPSFEHPLDDDSFPFEVQIAVDDYARKPQRVGDKYVVRLEPSEEYYVYVKSKCSQPVLVAVYVDGLSSIDKERREPSDLEDGRHWSLKADYAMKIPGWYTINKDKQTQQGNKFRIVERGDSLAAQQGFEDNIGMITVIFYANDAVSGQYVKYPKNELLENARSALGKSEFGTGAGTEFNEDLTFDSVKRGLMLGAVTYYYRSGDELKRIANGQSVDTVLGDDSELAKNDLDANDLGRPDNNDADKPKTDDETSSKTKPKKDDQELKVDP